MKVQRALNEVKVQRALSPSPSLILKSQSSESKGSESSDIQEYVNIEYNNNNIMKTLI